MSKLAMELGVKFRTGAPVERILVEDGRACGVALAGGGEEVVGGDVVIAAADYHHVEQELLEPRYS
jgi:phytoene desaturase